MANTEEKKEDVTIWKVIDACSKILIPLALAAIALVQGRNAENSRLEESKTANGIKVIELSWQSLTDTNQSKKIAALKLLNACDSKISRSLAFAIATDPNSSDDVRQQASIQVSQMTDNKALLKDYPINIYYLKNDSVSYNLAQKMSTTLKGDNIQSKVSVIQVNSFSNIGSPDGNEIRYDPDVQTDVTQSLFTVLNSRNSSWNCRLTPIKNKQTGTLSIVIDNKPHAENTRVSNATDAVSPSKKL